MTIINKKLVYTSSYGQLTSCFMWYYYAD